MEARLFRIAATVAILAPGICVPAFAAGARTQNFIVEADSQQFADQTAQWAEKYRRELALEWLGAELPPWHQPCPIRVIAGPREMAQGETSFVFDHQGTPSRWSMTVQGTQERVLDAVLPHEITHTIFATHFGRPLPRWADEGACTTVEHASERIKHEKNLISYLKTERGIAFNKMFAMKQYPSDILPLYAQGYSLARYLILQGGRQKYVKFMEDGLSWNNWNAAIEKHYGYDDLSDLQVTWLDWVRTGSPTEVASASEETQPIALVGGESPVAPEATRSAPPQPNAIAVAPLSEGLEPLDGVTRQLSAPNGLDVTRDGSPIVKTPGTNGGELDWYAKQRDLHVSRVGAAGIEPLPDNRRPQPVASMAAAPRPAQSGAVRVPPQLPPTGSNVEVLTDDVWSSMNGTSGSPTYAADVRPAPTAPASPLPRLVPIDPPGVRYGEPTGPILR